MIWADLRTRVLRGAASAPGLLIDEALREAAKELLVRTDCYKLEESFSLVVAQEQYSLPAPVGFEVNHILDMRIASRLQEIHPYTLEHVREVQRRNPSGTPVARASLDNTHFIVAPVPAEAMTVDAIYSVKPTDEADGLPDSIGLEYSEALVLGATARLLDQPDAPWRDVGMAERKWRAFSKERSRIAREVRYGFGGASLRVKHREFF